MFVKILRALACAGLVSIVSSTAEARVENNGPVMSSYGDGLRSLTKPSHSRNYKASSSKSHASASSSKRRYASKSSKSSKRYASSGKKRVRYAGGDGGSSRSCLQSSARALLSRIEAKFGSVSLISTCRPGAVIATSGKPSKHRNGLAIDFEASGRKSAIVQWLIANHHSGGTMTYRDMNHIHVDVGYHFVSLGANSGRG